MEFVSVADVWPCVFGNLRDRSGIEYAGASDKIGPQRAAQLDGARAALFERGVVKKRVGIGVDDFV